MVDGSNDGEVEDSTIYYDDGTPGQVSIIDVVPV